MSTINEELIVFLDNHEEVGLDIETSGLDPYKDDILLITIGNSYQQIVIELKNESLALKTLSKKLRKKIIYGHFLKFDLKFLYIKYKLNLFLENTIKDTYIAAKVVSTGYDIELNLKFLLHKYLNITIDKEVRSKFNNAKFITDEMITYAKKDVEYLISLYYKLQQQIDKHDLNEVVNLEQQCIELYTFIEINGFYLNKQYWLEVIDTLLKKNIDYKKNLNNYILNIN